jgi:hypothetical protein
MTTELLEKSYELKSEARKKLGLVTVDELIRALEEMPRTAVVVMMRDDGRAIPVDLQTKRGWYVEGEFFESSEECLDWCLDGKVKWWRDKLDELDMDEELPDICAAVSIKDCGLYFEKRW